MRSSLALSLALTLGTLLTSACASKAPAVDVAVKPAVAPAADLGAPSPTSVPPVGKDGLGHVACEKGKDHRTLELRTKGGGCETAYSKGGQAAVVASGKHGLAHCEAALKKIQAKLTAAGYACK